VCDLDGQAGQVAISGEFFPDYLFTANQNNANIQRFRGANGALNLRLRRVIASHCVNRDCQHERMISRPEVGGKLIRPLLRSLHGPYTGRSSGKPGAAVSVRDSSGTPKFPRDAGGRVRGGSTYAAWSGAALD
jgi:hypothetical protein